MKLFTRVDSSTAKQTTKIFLEHAKQDKKGLLKSVTLIPLGQLFETVAIPLLVSFLLQVLIQGGDLEPAFWLVGLIAASALFTTFFEHIGFLALFRHEEAVTTRLLERSLGQLLNHSHNFFANQKVGSLAGDINTFSRAYMTILDAIFFQLSGLLVSFIVSLVVISFIAPLLLLPLTALTVFIVWHNIHGIQSRAPFRNKRKELQSRLFGTIADIIGNHTLVRLFSKKDVELQRIIRERGEIIDVFEQEVAVLQKNATTRRLVLYLFQVGTLLLSIILFSNNQIEVGALVFAVTYILRVTGAMFSISGGIRTIEQAFLDSAKATEILITAPDINDRAESSALTVREASIRFQNVVFSYDDNRQENVFEDLTIDIPAGQHIGLVGKSGGGKTTLTNLLLRFADVDSGSIIIDEADITNITQASLRDAIAYVPQDPYLFHRTLRENIGYGTTGANDDEIISAARKANAWEFIETLPKGLDTIVGERGVKLSGGQRQRIAIARAILKDAPILVLDEATSALDSESEQLIQASLGTLMKGRTSIVIAHRLSTIAKLDRIIVLDHGRIVEDGTHSELIAKNGIYTKLWNHQSGGFIDQ